MNRHGESSRFGSKTSISVQVERLRALQPGWLEADSPVPSAAEWNAVEATLTAFMRVGAPTHHLYPTPDGHAELTTLPSTAYQLNYPIAVRVQKHADEFVADWLGVGAWGSGATEGEALEALQRTVVGLCTDLWHTSPEHLGATVLRWQKLLRFYVSEVTPTG